MRKVGILTLAWIFVSLALQAQTGRISLNIEDAEHRKLQAITATLYRAKDTAVVKVELSDRDGKVIFQRLPLGTFSLSVSGTGFQMWTKSGITISEGQADLDLGAIQLKTVSKELEAGLLHLQI